MLEYYLNHQDQKVGVFIDEKMINQIGNHINIIQQHVVIHIIYLIQKKQLEVMIHVCYVHLNFLIYHH